MTAGEVLTNEYGQALGATADQFITKAVDQGRIHETERPIWRRLFEADAHAAADALIALPATRFPANALAEGERPISEDSYMDYARACGFLSKVEEVAADRERDRGLVRAQRQSWHRPRSTLARLGRVVLRYSSMLSAAGVDQTRADWYLGHADTRPLAATGTRCRASLPRTPRR